MVEFEGVCNFERAKNGLVPVMVDTWETFVYVNLDGRAARLRDFLGAIPEIVAPLQLTKKLKGGPLFPVLDVLDVLVSVDHKSSYDPGSSGRRS